MTSTINQPTAVPSEDFEKIELLKRQVQDGAVGRGWVENVEALSTRAIATLIAELRRDPYHSSEFVEAGRRAAETIVQDRLARQQIEAAQRLTEELKATQIQLANQGRAARWLGWVVGVAAGLMTVMAGLSRFF